MDDGKILISVTELLNIFGIKSKKDWRTVIHIERDGKYSPLANDIAKQKMHVQPSE